MWNYWFLFHYFCLFNTVSHFQLKQKREFLVEGDVHPDRPSCLMYIKSCHACVASKFLVQRNKHNSLPLGPTNTVVNLPTKCLKNFMFGSYRVYTSTIHKTTLRCSPSSSNVEVLLAELCLVN